MFSVDQIKNIESYCESKGIKYYDVQQELVDHMLEWIEHEQGVCGDTFEVAFEKMQSTFSDEDFRDMVRSKSRSVSGMIAHNYKREFLSFFSWPKILITALLVLITILFDRYADIRKFPSVGINLFNIIFILNSFGRGNNIYHNRFNKVLELISIRQVKRMQIFFLLPSLIYLIFSLLFLQDIILPLEIYRVALFAFPVFILLTRAWRSASISANEKIRNDYPAAFRLR